MKLAEITRPSARCVRRMDSRIAYAGAAVRTSTKSGESFPKAYGESYVNVFLDSFSKGFRARTAFEGTRAVYFRPSSTQLKRSSKAGFNLLPPVMLTTDEKVDSSGMVAIVDRSGSGWC